MDCGRCVRASPVVSPPVTASMASSNTCASADDAGLPEAVGDASPFRSIHATEADRGSEALVSFPRSCRGSACGVRRIRVAQGEWRYQNVQGDARRCQIDARKFMR